MPPHDNHPGSGTNQTTDAYLLPHPIDPLTKPIPVSPARTTIGRSAQNTITISSNTVSRRHAVIVGRDGNYYIKDMESRNGTCINDEAITVRRIAHHDSITFGDRRFLFLRTSDDEGQRETDRLVDANSTITLSRDEFDPGSLVAYAAENARLGFFPKEEPIPQTEMGQPEKEAHRFSLLDRLSRGKSTSPDLKKPLTETGASKSMNQAHRRLSLLYRLSERLRIARSPQKILVDGLDLVLEAIPEADRAAIMLRTGRGGTLELAACRHRGAQNGDAHVAISRTLLDWVLTEKMALTTQNVFDDIRLKDSESIRVNHFNAIVCVPIIFEEKVIGILYVDSGNPFAQMTRDEVAFTAAVAHELALTIVNMQLQKTVIRNERMAAIGLTVSNLAHNIKNLTMMNQNAMDLMKIHLERIGDEKIDKSWKIIEKSVTRVNTLSMEMLEYASEQELSPTATDINRVIADNTSFPLRDNAGNTVNLQLELSADNPRWTIDKKQFQRALLNIIVNAVDATGNRPDGEIRITTAVENGRRLVVAVKDNGCGIDSDKQSKIFDLFFTTKGTKGSGLGLPMVNKFVQASGGKLLVESEKGAGTTVKMVFPLQR